MKSFTTDKFTYIDYTEMDDAMSRKVWECRNLPEIRKYMVNQIIIPFESHCIFVKKLRHNDNVLYYNVLSGGVIVGSINLHFNESDSAERGIYLDPSYQGKGLSKQICKDFYKHFRDNHGLRFITTKVLKDNVSSNALERSLGAEQVSEDDRFFYYKCDLNRI